MRPVSDPAALATVKKKRPNFDEVIEFCRSPKKFLGHLDEIGVDRAVLINYVAPEVIGFTPEVNRFVANYVKEDPKRLISCGSLHPRHSANILADVEQLLRLHIGMIDQREQHAVGCAGNLAQSALHGG